MSYPEQGGGGAESVVVNGTVEGVEIKPNGRYVVKVREVGSNSQYALSLNTKEQQLAQQMMGSIGQGFSFICGLSHWTNQAGQPVTSKWINGVAPLQGGMQGVVQQQPQPQQQQAQWGAAAQPQQQFQPQAPQPIPPPQPQQPQQGDDAFIRRVSWLAALGPAINALPLLQPEERTVAALIKMTDFFARTAILRGQHGFGQPPQQQAQQPQQGYGDPGPQDGDPYHQQQPTDQDPYADIPFLPTIDGLGN